MFAYSMSTSDNALTGSVTNRINITIFNINNPDWGYTRDISTTDRAWD